MKAILTSTLLMLICGFAGRSMAGGSGLTWNLEGTVPWGTKYRFDVLMGEKDRWDSVVHETPPLQPGKAMQLARQYVRKQIELRDGWREWRLDHMRMLRSADAEGREEWLYVVYFSAAKPGALRSGPFDLSVPVRMDGTIPEPVVSHR